MLELHVLFCVGPLGKMKVSFHMCNHCALGSPGKRGEWIPDFFFFFNEYSSRLIQSGIASAKEISVCQPVIKPNWHTLPRCGNLR